MNGIAVPLYSGKLIDPLNPQPGDITLIDIAHQLSNINRWHGATTQPFSVAEHAVRISLALDLDKELAFRGLHHDDAEIVVGDIVSPHKGPLIKAIEDRNLDAIMAHFGFATELTDWGASPGLPPEVIEADKRMLATERRDLFHPNATWELDNPLHPYPEKINPWPHDQAETQFLMRHHDLVTAMSNERETGWEEYFGELEDILGGLIKKGLIESFWDSRGRRGFRPTTSGQTENP